MNTRKVQVERVHLRRQFVERLTARTETLPLGDPAMPGTMIGPLITRPRGTGWP